MFFKLFAITLPIFFAMDMLWLGVLAKNFYRTHLSELMTTSVVWPAAILFYLLFIGGLVIFVISPAIEKGSLTHAIALGALFGLISYATYDLTNLATIKNWPVIVTIVDLAWGTFLSATVSACAYIVAKRLGL